MGHPSVYPTGTTIYNKSKAYSGYTVFPSSRGALLIDMNGNEVNLWAGLGGFPNKILPGGYVLGNTGTRISPKAYQDQLDLVQADWEGKIVWKFDRTELIKDEGQPESWQARQHHDFQREGSPIGYYAPSLEPQALSGNTLILVHENVTNPAISDKLLIDDKLIVVTWDGEIVWEWRASDHFEEFGFDEDAKKAIHNNPGLHGEAGGDWMHINSASWLGPNKWYEAGDERFHPQNILIDGRNTNTLNIIDYRTGKIVWKLGPRFDGNEAEKALGWIIGQHHFHMIPKGLPGAGDLLVYDNGGHGGYGLPNPASPDGTNNALRDFSRVLQFDPLTLEIKWQYTPAEAGHVIFANGPKFYSSYISSAQRLPNGNTLITEGSDGRLFEVTPEHETVWEYINPYYTNIPGRGRLNMVYRAYRVPYEWIPQLAKPEETDIAP
ncbi:MAG: aryl-sulfate sulfotransferase, partial [Lachnospiraceae bacterium]|nr:aryl-sulfate sulfotransferase [Lachnospiraceae bacterium]